MDGKTYPGGSPEKEPRSPRENDLSRICGELNRVGAKYIVVGGFAIIQAGFPRFTGDIDLLIDPSLENEALVFEALRILPDKAVDELIPGDVSRFTVVRVADELVVDLLANSCGVDYGTAMADAQYRDINGVRIPFASPRALWKMKQTVREKDIPDRLFLQKLLGTEKRDRPSPDSNKKVGMIEMLRRMLGKRP